MMATSSLSISVLGPLQVTVDGAPVRDFKYNKARALLAYLAVQVEAPHPRAELCALLWPDLPERSARRNLTQVLTALRDTLGENEASPAWLLTNAESVQLNPDVALNVDVARFGALLDDSERHAHRSWLTCSACAERLREALALYRGDFLSQIYVADSAPFEEWALLWRERLRQRSLSALERLAQRAEWRGDFGAAVGLARRQVELDSLREVGHRELMRLLALDGQASAAEAQSEQLRRMLAGELSVEPETETAGLHERIRAGRLESLRRYAAPLVNGPVAPNALIGREGDVQAVCEQLRADAIRALTITGAPGIGKTRLALEAAHALRFDFADGVHFVELAPVAEPGLVIPAIAQALGVKEKAGQPLAATLAAWLKARHALLVLDNFEHVLDAASLVADLLAACPAVKVLVTSRPPLRIRAEQQYLLNPLTLSAAAGLFSERARAARPAFALTPENAETIAALCAQVDHLPLAIELIAVRARTLSLTELRRQLDQPLDALSHGARDLPARHRTLRDAIAWSFDRLSADEQRVFAHLGVFAGGSSAEAAQAVVGVTPPALPSLEALIEASLVQAQVVAGETRFTLLETIREYALERLALWGELDAAQQRHADYFTRLAEHARPELDGPDQLTWFDRLEREHANLRAALTWSLAHNLTLGLQLAVAVMRFWSVRGHLSEGRRWLQSLLTQGEKAPRVLRARALVVTSRLAFTQGDFREALDLARSGQALFLQLEHALGIAQAQLALGLAHLGLGDYVAARTHIEESLELCRGEADQPGMAEAFNALGHIAQRQGDYAAAKSFFAQALELYRGLNDPRNTAGMSLNRGVTAFEQGDYETAYRLTEASLTVFRQLRDTHGLTTALLNLGNTLLETGNLDRARAYFEEAIALERSLGSGNVAIPLGGLGRALRRLGDLKGARACFAESLQLRLQAGDRRGVAVTLTNFAHIFQDDHRPDRAARLLGAAEAIRKAIGAPIHPNRREEYEQLLAGVRAALSEEGFATAWAAGSVLTPEQAAAVALE